MTLKRKLTEDSEEDQCRSPKKMAAPNPILKMEIGSFYIPKDNPSKPLGEDAHFVCAEKQTVGLADGVGGWAAEGIDAGEYARELMRNCADAVAEEPSVVDPKRELTTAFHKTNAKGSSTACIVSLVGEVLRTAIVGDSGFMIFRGKTCTYKSPVQQRKFNHPFQLGKHPGSDKPDIAWGLDVPVIAGDIVVVGTDGLMDNMFESEIGGVLEKGADKTVELEELACQLAALAMCNSYDRKYDSPFAVAARAAGHREIGGKIDDITVIVLRIMSSG